MAGKQGERTRRRLSTEERREQLLSVGARLFSESPYDEVWIEQVAEIAGVSRGLLYHYFPTKRTSSRRSSSARAVGCWP